MLHHVIEACHEAGITDVIVVIGNGGERVKEATPHRVRYVWQEEQLGTGHAVLSAKEHIRPEDKIVVLFGDSPLITPDFLKDLHEFKLKEQAAGVVVATYVEDPTGYGRVITDDSGGFLHIIEQKDLEPHQHTVDLVNTSVFIATGSELLYGLERLKNNNNQNEYYLTDVPKILKESNRKIAVYTASNADEFLGVNSQKQLYEAGVVMRRRIADKHLNNGVVIMDIETTYIDADVEIGRGAILYPGVILQGKSSIGKGAVIGPYSQIYNSTIGPKTHVRQSVVEGAKVGEACQIGPFTYLRAGAVLGDNCRVGDFVEIKNATLGNNSKAAHLAYIGDAEIGEGVNFGCGAVTVNYDGKLKHKTVVEDGAFIGSNVNLVAPIRVHKDAFVAAGSTITDNVPPEALAIARQKQTNKEGRAKHHKK